MTYLKTFIIFILLFILILWYIIKLKQLDREMSSVKFLEYNKYNKRAFSKIPNVIYTYWNSPNRPPLVEKCINSWRRHNPSYEIIILSQDNLKDYIPFDINNLRFERNFETIIEWWNTLFINTNMSEDFFDRHIQNINWYWVCENTNLSENFFQRHIDKVNWSCLCSNTNISEPFFEKYIYNVNWCILCKNKNISEKFLEKYIQSIDKECLILNDNLSIEFILKHCKEEHLPHSSKLRFLNYKVKPVNTYRNNSWIRLL